MIENLYSLTYQVVVFFILVIGLNVFLNFRIRKISATTDQLSTASAILKASIFISIALVVSELGELISPLTSTLRLTYSGNEYYIKLLEYLSIFTGIGVILIMIDYFISLLIFNIISAGRNLVIEVSSNNWGLTVLYAAIFVSIAIFIKSEMVLILDYLIPYPTARVLSF